MNPNATNNTNKVLHKELSYKLNGIMFHVQNELGRFCREHQYQDALEKEFIQQQIPYKREFPIPLSTDIKVPSNKVDFIVDKKILIDLKAKSIITKEDYFQMKRYLEASNMELGLIVNFRNRRLYIKRILRPNHL